MEDVRYSEFVFLREIAKGTPAFELFNPANHEQTKTVGLGGNMYVDMAVTLIEDLYVRLEDANNQILVSKPRGAHEAIGRALTGWQGLQKLHITYRGLRRIEELRELLSRDRILEPFGVLLDARYFRPDLKEALGRGAEIPVSVIYSDLDHFKAVNTEGGHPGGDVVITKYMEVVRDALGVYGQAYRVGGDEVASILIGQGHDVAVKMAETIRANIKAMECELKGKKLPRVTTSIGVATTPPLPRTLDLETVADQRNQQAKDKGRNCVISLE